MARPIWSGNLTFGLVTVPVAIHAAVRDNTVRFHELERGTCDRIRIQRINERTGEPVAYDDLVKGFEVEDGECVAVEQSELEEIAPGRSKSIEIRDFVDLDEVEPAFFDASYFLGPRGEEYAKVYALLRDALAASNRAGIAVFAMRGRPHLTAVKADGSALVLHTMHFAEQMRRPADVFTTPPRKTKPSARELAVARQLIDTMTVDWNPDAYHDEYRKRVLKLVEAKRAGRKPAPPRKPAEATNVVDLMDALQRSVRQSGRGAAPARSANRSRNAAASTRSAEPTRSAKQPKPTKRTKQELYARAAELGVEGRSTMTRDQLDEAVKQAERRANRGRGKRSRKAA